MAENDDDRGFVQIGDFFALAATLILAATIAWTPRPGGTQPDRAAIKVRLERLPGEPANEVCARAALPTGFCRSKNVDLTDTSATITIDPAAIDAGSAEN